MADGTVETRNYDLLNHLIKQETSNATGVIAGYTYTLDAGHCAQCPASGFYPPGTQFKSHPSLEWVAFELGKDVYHHL